MKVTKIALALLLVLGFTLSINADQKKTDAPKEKSKQTTLKGDLVCGKCSLGISKTCTPVLVVTKKGKKVNYFIDGKTDPKISAQICGSDTKLSVSILGVVFKKGDKNYVKTTKLTIKEDKKN